MPQYNHIGRAHTQIRYTDADGQQVHPQGRRRAGAAFTYREVHVLYHDKHVACFNENEICLRTHGHRTMTTKVRMNQTANQFNLAYSVYQRRGQWFIKWQGQQLAFPANGSIILNRRQAVTRQPNPHLMRPDMAQWVDSVREVAR